MRRSSIKSCTYSILSTCMIMHLNRCVSTVLVKFILHLFMKIWIGVVHWQYSKLPLRKALRYGHQDFPNWPMHVDSTTNKCVKTYIDFFLTLTYYYCNHNFYLILCNVIFLSRTIVGFMWLISCTSDIYIPVLTLW